MIAALQKAYSMEMETVANYLADSVNLDGVRAEEIKKSLAADVQEELGHAKRLAHRIKQLGGAVPGATGLEITHSHLDADSPSTDVQRVIQAVIDDEQAAIDHYKQIIRDVDGKDYVTQDLCIKLLADEDEHITQFEGFMKEYTEAC
jgi:bacterioferritin